MSRFDDAAARRYALLALDVENANTGYAQGYITRKPRTVDQEAVWLVNGWFADVYGWPLNPRERAQYQDFLARVRQQISFLRLQETR